MIELLINDKILKIPSEYKEVPISKGIQIVQYIQKPQVSFNDKVVVLSTLTNIEPTVYLGMSVRTIDDIYNNLSFLKDKEQELYFYKTFTLNKINYGFVDFDDLTVAEFADLQFYLSESEYILENIDKILTVLFRPIISKKQSSKFILINILSNILNKNIIPKVYKEYKIQKYSITDVKRAELFNSKMSMDFAIASYKQLEIYLNTLINEFPSIFNTNKKPEDKEQYDDETITKNRPKTFEQNWGFYHCIASLSNGIIEQDVWKSKNIREFLVYLTYHNQKTELENQRILSQQAL